MVCEFGGRPSNSTNRGMPYGCFHLSVYRRMQLRLILMKWSDFGFSPGVEQRTFAISHAIFTRPCIPSSKFADGKRQLEGNEAFRICLLGLNLEAGEGIRMSPFLSTLGAFVFGLLSFFFSSFPLLLILPPTLAFSCCLCCFPRFQGLGNRAFGRMV